MPMIPADRVAQAFVDVADTLVDDFDLIDFLHRVTTHTAALVEARAVGLLLADHHGRLQLMAASDERAEMVELFQVQAVEGPCQDAYRTATPVVHSDLVQAGEQWPSFAPMAVDAGYRSVHAFPLRLRREALGALNLFSDTPGTLDPPDVRTVQALADVATIGLLQERAIRHGEQLTSQLQAALHSRVTIEQAKGALAQIHGESPDDAFDRLRAYARRHQLRLGDVAARVVSRPRSLDELTERRD